MIKLILRLPKKKKKFYLIKVSINKTNKKPTRKRIEGNGKYILPMFSLIFFSYLFLLVSSELSWCIKGVNDDNELTFTAPFFLKSPKGHYKQI